MPRKTRRRKAGAKISEGITGQVYYPALSCKDPAHNLAGDYVTKRVSKKIADREMALSAKLREFKPDYAIYPEHVCEGEDGSFLLFSKYGGDALVDYYTALEAAAYATPPRPIDEDEYSQIVSALEALLPAIDDLHAHGIYHNDISFDNTLFNHKTKKAYLIDFERSGPVSKGRDDKQILQEMIGDLKEFKEKIPKKAGTRRRSKSRLNNRHVKQWEKTYGPRPLR